MPTQTCTAREQVWAHIPRLLPLTAPIVATVVEKWPEGTKMGGVVLPSTTPTGGTNFEIEVSVLTKKEMRESVGEGRAIGITGSGLTGRPIYVCMHVLAS